MKTKRLVIIFSVLTALVLVIVLGSTVFTIQKAELVFKNELNENIEVPDRFSNLSASQLIGSVLGKSIFFVSEKNLIETIEKQFPYLNIIAIERLFPNCINFHCLERVPVMVIEKSGTKYLLDNEGFVVGTVITNAGYIELDNTSNAFSSLEVGTFAQVSEQYGWKLDVILNVLGSIWELNYDTPEFSMVINNIVFEDSNIKIATTTGSVIVLTDCMLLTKEKMLEGYGVWQENNRSGKVITVRVFNGGIEAVVTDLK